MGDDWGVLGTVITGAVALIIALGRGWLLTPLHVEQWRSRHDEMRRDRDFWRAEALRGERQTREALQLPAENESEADHESP